MRTQTTRNRPHRSSGPPRTWVIQDRGEGQCDLVRNGRAMLYDVTVTSAKARIEREMCANDRVIFREIDGYRREITKKM